MIVAAYKTNPVVAGDQLFQVLRTHLPELHEKDIVVVTSKIVSICEKRIRTIFSPEDKRDLVRKESQQYIDTDETRRYGFQLTIAHNICIPNAGIDESNGNGYAILWPKDPMKSARDIWKFLKKTYRLQEIGVVVSDSHTTMLRKGTTGIGLSWCGFQPLNNYIGHTDVFKRKLKVTKAQVLDGLAASAVLVMGEGDEQTPLAVITGAQNVVFTNRPPTKQEIDDMHISIEEDMYAPLLLKIPWQKGGNI